MDLIGILNGKVRQMSHVYRYSSIPVNRRENVAEHSWWVAFIGLLICEDIMVKGRDVDREQVLACSIVHDLPECISGDIIRTYKHSSQEILAAMKFADEENMHELTSKMGRAGTQVYLDWMEAKDGSVEGQIVAYADMVAVVIYCQQEYELGNRNAMPTLKNMYESWFHKYHHHDLFKEYTNRMFPNRKYTDAFASIAPFPRDMTIAGKPINRVGEGPTSEHDFSQDGGEVPLS